MTSVNVTTTKNTVTVSEGDTRIVTIKTQGPQGPAFADGDIGDIVISGGGTVATIDNGVINNAKIASNAAIAGSKIDTSSFTSNITITNDSPIISLTDSNANSDFQIKVDGGHFDIKDVTNNAGRLNIQSDGTTTISGNLNASSGLDVTGSITATASISVPDAVSILLGGSNDLSLKHDGTHSRIHNNTGALLLETDSGSIQLNKGTSENMIVANVDGKVELFHNGIGKIETQASGIGVSGDISVSGTVDGRDVATDGTKLDGIETGATADQTAAEIKTLLDSNGIVNSNVNASAAIDGTKISANFGSQSIISSLDGNQVSQANAALVLTHATNSNLRANHLIVDDFPSGSGTYFIQATESGISNDRNMCLQGYGGKLKIGSNSVAPTELLDVAGNIAVSGTVDGRDVAADGTKLDGIESNATADQTASEILTLLKTVDGSGSGLDADTLDGISSASFLRSDTNATFSGSTLTVNATLLLLDSIRIGDDAFIEDYNAANSVRIKGNQDTNKGFIAFGQQTKKLGVDGASAALTYDGNTVIDSAYTGALANGITATTQSASDNSTKVATTAYTDTAISNLVNSAPSTLDTLKELSDALGSDPNFATTVTNSIATKLPLAGGTLTGLLTIENANPAINFTDNNNNPDYQIGNLNGVFRVRDTTNSENRLVVNTDGHIDILGNLDVGNGIDVTGTITATSSISVPDAVSIFLGTGNDLSLKHDGSSSRIRNDTGALVISCGGSANANPVKIQPNEGEEGIVAHHNERVELYFDNSKKLETQSIGITVTGQVECDELDMADSTGVGNNRIKLGTGDDLQIYHDGSDSYLKNTTGHLKIGDANVRIMNAACDEDMIHAKQNEQVELYYDNSKKLETTSSGITVTGGVTATALDLGDSKEIKLGDSDDLKLFHNGSHSYIAELGTGDLRITGSAIHLQNAAQSENLLKTFENGKVELYYDNSKKLETMSDGVSITGHADITGELNLIGSGAKYLDVDTLTNSNTFFIRHRSNTGSNFESAAKFIGNGAVELYYDHSKKLETKSNGVEITGNVDISGLLSIDDNQKAVFGDSHDLQIYHDGTNSYILDNGTGHLNIKTNGHQIILTKTPHETLAVFNTDGSNELYYDNSKKLETTSYGVAFVDEAKFDNNTTAGRDVIWDPANDQLRWLDNTKATFGSESDLQIFFDGTHSKIDHTPATGSLFLGGDGLVLANSGFSEYYLTATENGAVQLNYDAVTKLETTSEGISVVGQVDLTRQNTASEGGEIAFRRANDNTKQWYIDVFGNTNDAGLRFHSETGPNGSGRTYAELSFTQFVLNFGLDLNINHVAGKLKFQDYLNIHHDGTHSRFHNNTGALLLETDNNSIQLNKGTSENMVKANIDGSVELYYDNSKKLETTSAGATVTGNFQNNGQIIANLQANISTQGNPALIITSSTNTNMRANFLMEDDYTSGRGALMIQVTESGVSNDRDLILMGFGGKTGVGGTPTSDFHVHGNSAFNGTIGVGVTSPLSNNKLHLRLADSSIATPSTASVLLAENNTNAWITIGSGASSYGGILFGDSGQSDRGQVRFNHNGDIMQLIANEEKLFQATLNGTAELYFDNGVKLKTNTAGVIVQNDVYLNNANSNVFFNSDGSSFYGSSPAIGRAGSDNFHITGSGAGDLVIAAEYGERIIFGLTTNTSGAPTIKMTMNPGGQIDGDFNDTSDANLKENITPIPDNAIADIKKLKPVTFDWKETNGNNNVSGFIAQDVKEVIPNLINGKEWSEEDQSSRYTINTIGVVAHLTKALQEAIAKIELLETKVATLEAE